MLIIHWFLALFIKNNQLLLIIQKNYYIKNIKIVYILKNGKRTLF